jgi:hypothetical protein
MNSGNRSPADRDFPSLWRKQSDQARCSRLSRLVRRPGVHIDTARMHVYTDTDLSRYNTVPSISLLAVR